VGSGTTHKVDVAIISSGNSPASNNFIPQLASASIKKKGSALSNSIKDYCSQIGARTLKDASLEVKVPSQRLIH